MQLELGQVGEEEALKENIGVKVMRGVDLWVQETARVPVWLEERRMIERWVQKEGQIHSNMDGPEDYHTKWNQTEKDKCHMMPHMESLKYDTDRLPAKQAQTPPDTESRRVAARGEGAAGGLHWKFQISRCKLLYKNG